MGVLCTQTLIFFVKTEPVALYAMNLGCVSLSPTTFEKEHLSTNVQPDLGDIQILFLKKEFELHLQLRL